jgi:flavorubredoxin
MPREITKGIFWVGAKDFTLRDFHSYWTSRGTTYNAYLVRGNRSALVDTVKETHFDQLLRRVETLVPLEELDYLVVNHCELDHMGSLERILSLAPRAKVIASAKGAEGILLHFPGLSGREITVVKPGDTLDLGGITLAFYPIPMVHWPDSMATYAVEPGVLMPNDAFGQHYAAEALFDDEAPKELVLRELQKYYASIVDLLNPVPVRKAIEAVKSLSPKIIAPSHGVIWRAMSQDVIALYEAWASGSVEVKATLVYDTMYGATEAMARIIEEGFESEGVPISVYRASVSDFQEVLADTMVSRGIIVGGPTMNNRLYPPVAFFLEYLAMSARRERLGFVFSAYGWGGGAEKDILGYFEQSGIKPACEPWRVRFRPTDQDLSSGLEMAKAFARLIKGG